GCFWGLILSSLWRTDNWQYFVAILGPGYVVTLGYIIRSLTTPPIWGRLLIWIGSFLVQGAWLLLAICAGNSVERQLTNPITAWWIFATLGSVVGLLADLPKSLIALRCSQILRPIAEQRRLSARIRSLQSYTQVPQTRHQRALAFGARDLRQLP